MSRPMLAELDPIEIDPRPCAHCGLTINRHERIDTPEGPDFFCLNLHPDEMTLIELERRAELRREEECAAIFARLEAMDDPSVRLPPRTAPATHRPAKSTQDAFRYLTAAGDVSRLSEWLADRPKDAPVLLALLDGRPSAS
jgi:hypothetical protein